MSQDIMEGQNITMKHLKESKGGCRQKEKGEAPKQTQEGWGQILS